MLRREAVPARHLRPDRPRRIRLRHDPPLDLVAPPATTSCTHLDIHPAPRLRSVNYLSNIYSDRSVCDGSYLAGQLAPDKVGAENRLLHSNGAKRRLRRAAAAILVVLLGAA